jgi:hypothetical protein
VGHSSHQYQSQQQQQQQHPQFQHQYQFTTPSGPGSASNSNNNIQGLAGGDSLSMSSQENENGLLKSMERLVEQLSSSNAEKSKKLR